ncbi:FMN-binding glutamate synthase family protein [Martelella mediterranea]|uniref:Glutamate synthase [NADPH] large chain n=1 Tax=Martelella mediterranea DSM 17316 TaxID=1122214 RepID=A0A1U9Z0V8_9HYPH|nr:FMN-binding glutamate synthase family protein [Martelella mediterranea]AQZ51319.1 Glutamate synthase [NADPH] large chain precursor [Martelella mediterranea DSM 17316]
MLDMLMRCIVPIAAAFFTVIAIATGWFWILLITIPLLAIAFYDWFQSSWTITRNYPVAGRIRWIALSLRPFIRAYAVEDDTHGTPYSYAARQLIRTRAHGLSDTVPFGTELEVYEDPHHWISHSMAPHTDPDRSPRVTVGNEQSSKPYEASILNISAMSFGALSANAVRAMNIGAKTGGFYQDTGEGGLSRYHLEHGGDVVWEIGSGYFGARDKDGHFDPEKFRDKAANDAVKMTEIKVSQGAKPGHGGMLLGSKVTPEIAEVRGVPVYQNCLSPRGHSAFSTPVEMLEFAAKMRDLSGGKPVGIKFCVGQPHEPFALVKAMLSTGIYPDFIVIDGAEGGTGAAPLELADWVGMPLWDGLIIMRNALVGAGVKKHVRLAASGKVFSGMGLAHNLALGADWCNAARAFMMSVGCIQAQRCHTGTCPTGVTTQDKWRQRALVPEEQGANAARFHKKTVEALSEIVAACGYAHPQDLQPHHIMHRLGSHDAVPLDKLHTFLPEGVLVDDPDSTLYADWWRAASPDSFRPAADLVRMRASAG